MADLIDRKRFDKALEDVLIVASGKLALGKGPLLVNELTIDYISKVREWLKEEPTVDAVPVIRCKYCKHWAVSACDPDAHYCKRIDPEDGPEGIDFLECDFCSYAEPVNKPVESVDNLGGINND